jgi:hypothetical protein
MEVAIVGSKFVTRNPIRNPREAWGFRTIKTLSSPDSSPCWYSAGSRIRNPRGQRALSPRLQNFDVRS